MNNKLVEMIEKEAQESHKTSVLLERYSKNLWYLALQMKREIIRSEETK